MFLLKTSNPVYFTKRLYVTVGKLIEQLKMKLEELSVPEAETSVKMIVSSVLTEKRRHLNFKHVNRQKLNPKDIAKINKLCECRIARMPVQYILKQWEFRNIKLNLHPPVFIPRPETEELIDIVLHEVGKFHNFLEIGCGSGAISISLLKSDPNCKCVAIDSNNAACILSKTNAILNGVDSRMNIKPLKLSAYDVCVNGMNFVEEQYDFIISNPPYLFTSELAHLEPEIKLYEDLRALDGGSDGLAVIKSILSLSSNVLESGKHCFLEVHHQHRPMIESWLRKRGDLELNYTKCFKDFLGYDRFVQITKI